MKTVNPSEFNDISLIMRLSWSLNDVKDAAPRKPKSRDQDPEQAIGIGESWSWIFVLEDSDLLSQRNILYGQILPPFQRLIKSLNKNDEPLKHVSSLTRRFRKRNIVNGDEFSGTTGGVSAGARFH